MWEGEIKGRIVESRSLRENRSTNKHLAIIMFKQSQSDVPNSHHKKAVAQSGCLPPHIQRLMIQRSHCHDSRHK